MSDASTFIRDRLGPVFGAELLQLAAITPAGKFTGHVFRLDDVEAMTRFINQHTTANLYYGLNPVAQVPESGKAREQDIGQLVMLGVDFDPVSPATRDTDMAEVRKKLSAFPLPYTALVDTGRGLQAVWVLKNAVYVNGNLDELRRYTEQLCKVLGADSTFDLCRLFRLPWTTNHLSDAKRKKGWTEAAPTRLLEWTDKRYELTDFDPIFGMPVLTKPTEKKPKQQDRSRDLLAKVGRAIRDGKTDAEIHALYDSHPHAADQPNPTGQVQRCIDKVRQESDAEETARLQELNAQYAVVNWSGRTLVFSEPRDPETKWLRVQLQSFSDFKAWQLNKGRIGKLSLADWWLKHPQRRQYNGVVFAPGKDYPGYQNLWRGFGVTPAQGDCSRWLEMTRDVICSGRENLYRYVIGWCADAVQNPANRPGVTLVLIGKQGTGKGTFARELGALFGDHFIHIRHSEHLVGKFNAHLARTLLVFADEAFFAGDRKGEGALKALITEPDIPIEFKGKDVITVRNHNRIVMATNHDWAVQAAMDDRRLAIIDVSEARRQDTDYFDSINAQMRNGGREALLDHLLKFDLRGIDLRKIPDTQARRDQQALSLDPFSAFWLEKLKETDYWEEEQQTAEVVREYRDSAGRYPMNETQFGIRLRKLFPTVRKVRKRDPDSESGRKARKYQLPPIAMARQNFEKDMGRTFDWAAEEVACEDDDDAGPARPTWLQAVGTAAIKRGLQDLKATPLLRLSKEGSIAIPGERPDMDAEKLLKLIGKVLAEYFQESEQEQVRAGDIRARRWLVPGNDGRRSQPIYQFWRDGEPPPSPPKGCEERRDGM